jgi:glycerol-3-phosphate acyltransferase PlsY
LDLCTFLLAPAAGYALGNLSFADLAARFASEDETDLRSTGSQNPGALNAGKELGSRWGAVVLTADVGKAWASAAIGRQLGGAIGANVAACAAVAGHCYPAGQRTGGKGVSASIGQVLGTFPRYLPVDIAVALGTVAIPKWTQRTWAATAVASTVWVSSAAIAWRRGWPTGVDAVAPGALPLAALVSSALIGKRFLDDPLIDGKPIER